MLGSNDVLLTYKETDALAPWKSQEFSHLVKIPENTTSGKYFILIVADYTDKIEEKSGRKQ